MKFKDRVREVKEGKEHFGLNLRFVYDYILSGKSKIIARYTHSETSPLIENLYSGTILTSYWQFKQNDTRPKLLKTHAYGLRYLYKNLLNLSSFSLGFRAIHNTNGFFAHHRIEQDQSVVTIRMLPVGNRRFEVFFNGESYLHPLRSTFSLRGSYSLMFDKNFINGSQERKVEHRRLYLHGSFRTGFETPFNVEVEAEYAQNNFLLEEEKTSNNSELNLFLKGTYTLLKTLDLKPTLKLLNPSLEKQNGFLLLDLQANLQPTKSQFAFGVTATNLTEKKMFRSVDISDFYIKTQLYRLLTPTVFGTISYRF